MILNKQQKEKLVLDLYSQGKTYRQIVKEVRISSNDIRAILKKKEEAEEERNNTITKNQQLSPSTKAYELYFKGKSPVQVAIDLNIPEAQATQFYREYWKLEELEEFDSLYEGVGDKISVLVQLYQNLIERTRRSIDQVVNAVDTAANKLPYM